MKMRFNSNIVYVVIALAFVGGLFSLVAAQSIPTITLSGNTHTTGDADIDGDLNVVGSINGYSIGDHEARILALEASMASNEPMLLDHESRISANEPMIASHDTMILDHDARILAAEADIVALEQAGGGAVCDTDSDGVLTPQELLDFFILNGVTGLTLNQIINGVGSIENEVSVIPDINGVIDTQEELNKWNGDWNVPFGLPLCPALI